MFRWLLLVLSLLIVDCRSVEYIYTAKAPVSETKRPEIPVWVDHTFGEVDRLAIDDAINTWNFVLNGNRKLRVVSWSFNMQPSEILDANQSDGLLILKISKTDQRVWPGDLAWVDHIGGRVVYVVREHLPRGEDLKPVMLHELGHILGAEHRNGDNLMNPKFDRHMYQCVDEQTAGQVARKQFILLDDMNFCVIHM